MRTLSEIYGSSSKFSLEQRALNKLAKMCWGKCILIPFKDAVDDDTVNNYVTLVTHRNAVIKQLPQMLVSLNKSFSDSVPKLLMHKLIDAVFRVEQGYVEAMSWEERYHEALPFSILDPVTAGDYQAGCFIDPSGHFDDLSWVKRFLADNEMFIHNRFELACLYCFEEKIREMWDYMKAKRQLPCKGQCFSIDKVYYAVVGIWAWDLENMFDLLDSENRSYGYYTRSDNIYIHGLIRAICEGHEYAVQYFWSQCCKTEGFSILNDIDFLDIISEVSNEENYALVNFVYSNLSLEEKIATFVSNDELCEEIARVWTCLLLSPFYECALSDILKFPCPILAVTYEEILTKLVWKVIEFGVPIHKTIVQLLWNHLSYEQRSEVLQINSEKDKLLIYELQILYNH